MTVLDVLPFHGLIFVDKWLFQLLVVVVSLHHLVQFITSLGFISVVGQLDALQGLQVGDVAIKLSWRDFINACTAISRVLIRQMKWISFTTLLTVIIDWFEDLQVPCSTSRLEVAWRQDSELVRVQYLIDALLVISVK